MTARTTATATAALMIAAAVAVNVAFTGLGIVFDYPDVLAHPPGQALEAFRAHEGAVVGWFVVLAVGAALLAPIGVGVGRLSDARAMRWAVPVAIAAAAVQVVGLSRWALLVPGWAADGSPAAVDSFATANHVMGTLIGETGGYLLTAAWTALVLVALGRGFAGRWFVALGAVSAVLILAGVLVPLGVPGTDLANFAGYVLWSVWIVAFGIRLLVRRPVPAEMSGALR